MLENTVPIPIVPVAVAVFILRQEESVHMASFKLHNLLVNFIPEFSPLLFSEMITMSLTNFRVMI